MICAPTVERQPERSEANAERRRRREPARTAQMITSTEETGSKLASLWGKRAGTQSRRGPAASTANNEGTPVYPVLPSRNCQIIRQSRSVSPRSITWSGVEPSNCLFGRCNHSPITEPLMISASASNRRVTSFIFCTLERCGGVPAFQYETVLGDAPVTRLTTSFDNLYVRDSRRTSALVSVGAPEILAEARVAPALLTADFLRNRLATLERDFLCSFMCSILHAILQLSCQIFL